MINCSFLFVLVILRIDIVALNSKMYKNFMIGWFISQLYLVSASLFYM